FDLVFAHMTLLFVAKDQRVPFLRNIGLALGERGRLLLFHQLRYRKPEHDPDSEARLFAARVASALAERGVTLPDDKARFEEDLRGYGLARRARDDNVITFEEVEADLARAGLRIAEVIDHSRPRAPSKEAAAPVISTRAYVAAFGG